MSVYTNQYTTISESFRAESQSLASTVYKTLNIMFNFLFIFPLKFGFFHRRNHEEIKQKREEIQNLEEHGVTPMGAGVYGVGTSQKGSNWDGTDL